MELTDDYGYAYNDEFTVKKMCEMAGQENVQDISDCIQYIRACAENEYNQDYFRTFYKTLSKAMQKAL